MSIECQQVREGMSLWLDGRLETAQVGRLRAHVDGCPVCRAEIDAMRCVDRWLSDAPMVSPPTGFVARFQSRLAGRPVCVRTLAALPMVAGRCNRRHALVGLTLLTLATMLAMLVGVEMLTLSSLWTWPGGAGPTADLLQQIIRSLLVVGKAAESCLKPIIVVWGALGRALSHPFFASVALGTALLAAAWAWIVGIRPRTVRPMRL